MNYGIKEFIVLWKHTVTCKKNTIICRNDGCDITRLDTLRPPTFSLHGMPIFGVALSIIAEKKNRGLNKKIVLKQVLVFRATFSPVLLLTNTIKHFEIIHKYSTSWKTWEIKYVKLKLKKIKLNRH